MEIPIAGAVRMARAAAIYVVIVNTLPAPEGEHPEIRDAIGWAIEAQAQAHTVDTQLFSTALLLRVNETGVVYAFGNANGSPNPQIITP